MIINAGRIERDIETIASFSEVPADVGFSRPTFSEMWAKARDFVIDEAKKIGCAVRTDAAGNVHLRPAAIGWEKAVWLSGSHIDSVPTGGKYDGVVGIVVPLEVLRVHPNAELELIIFAEEEGTTFNLGMLGSRTWVGSLSAGDLANLINKHGQTALEAGKPHGVDPPRMAIERLEPSQYRGLIEVHVEQGVSMWNSKTPAAVVTAINGRRQFWCTFTGAANHAGSTKMTDRSDALVAAAEAIVALEKLGLRLHGQMDHTVITVGRVEVSPNALNVIPGEVRLSIDLRAKTDKMLDDGEAAIRSVLAKVAAERKLPVAIERTETLPALPMDKGVCDLLRAAGKKVGVKLPDVASGALHDAAILAKVIPTAMLFVSSQGGISHNPKEFSRIEDIALAAEILAAAVTA